MTAQGPGGTGPGDDEPPDSQAHGGEWPADELEARRRARGERYVVLPAASRDLVAMFVDQPCVLGAGHEAPVAKLYEAYVAWCKASGRGAETGSMQGFARQPQGGVPAARHRPGRGAGRPGSHVPEHH